MTQESIEDRLYGRCVEAENGCWLFTGASDSRGYGRIYYEGRLWLTHRVSWTITYGEIPIGLCVCHTCDDTSCCNPKHLFTGTHQDNENDKRNKGRTIRGSNQGCSKLTTEQVTEIRLSLKEGIEGAVLAHKYGVARSTISKLKYFQRWSWLEA